MEKSDNMGMLLQHPGVTIASATSNIMCTLHWNQHNMRVLWQDPGVTVTAPPKIFCLLYMGKTHM